MTRRILTLDTLRGLAALAVVAHHCLLLPSAFDGTRVAQVLHHSPLGIVLAGKEAVMIFFILSGFVLTLPFLKGPVDYRQFLVKRVCRIYLPYYAAVAMALLLAYTVARGPIPALGDWFNQTWTRPLTLTLLAQHLLLVGEFPNASLNTAFWSLVQEMRVSLIFPLIPFLLHRLSWKQCLFLSAGVSLTGMLLTHFMPRVFHVTSDVFLTLHVVGLFITGGLLAMYRQAIGDWFHRLSFTGKLALLLAALLAYTVQLWDGYTVAIPGASLARLLLVECGAALFIVFAFASRRAAQLLTLRPLHFMGLISFSIYLFHGNILYALVHRYYGVLPLWQIWGLTLIGTLTVASLAYYLFEIPSIRYGRRFADLFRRPAAVAPPPRAPIPS